MPGSLDERISSDRPITSGDKDRLGFSQVCENLGKALLSRPLSDGLVISIEGAWGSGKSSLVNLLVNHLDQTPGAAKTIRFDPWIITNRDTLIIELFGGIIKAIEQIGGSGAAKERAKAVVDKIKGYASTIAKGGAPLARVAELFGVPYAGIAADLLKRGGEIAESVDMKLPLPDLKKNLSEDIKNLNHRLFVVIDDMDRLEPAEIVEIVRLVKSVADFHNIVYVLCLDRKVVSKAIKEFLKVEDGEKFLEKVIQVAFSIPRPE